MTMVISERHTGHPPSITDTRIAHASQKRARPHAAHGTSAKPPRGATKQTSQQSSDVVASASVVESDVGEVVATGTGSCWSSSSFWLLLLLSSSRSCRHAVCAPTE